LAQGAEIRPPQRLGRDPDDEGCGAEGGDGQAGAVDADAVAEVGVREDGGAVGDCEGGAVGGIVRFEMGDGWAGVRLLMGCVEREGRGGVLPIVSTMPVNMVGNGVGVGGFGSEDVAGRR